jgi:hypothetical protein
MYGMLFKNLTDEIITEILQIYERVTGGRAFLRVGKIVYPKLRHEQVLEEFKHSNCVERRFGSKLSMHSKLLIFKNQVIYFEFHPIMDRYSKDEHKKKAEDMVETFEKEVNNLLIKKKLQVSWK